MNPIALSRAADILGHQKNLSYKAFIEQWRADQASGYATGKCLKKTTIDRNEAGVNSYWAALKQEPSILKVTVDSIRQAIASTDIGKIATRRNIYESMLSLYKYLVLKKLRPEIDIAFFRKFTPAKNKNPRRTFVTEKQFSDLIATNEGWLSCRTNYDRELLSLFMMMAYKTGMRSSEMCKLELGDIDWQERIIHIRGEVSKTGLERDLGIDPDLYQQMISYQRIRPESPHRFFLLQKSGRPTHHLLFSRRIRKMCEIKKIKFDITPHGFRRSLTTELLKEHAPAVVQKITGHTDIKTLQLYDMGTSREALDVLRKPKQKPGKKKRKKRLDI